MAIDFDVEPEFQLQIDGVKQFAEEEIEPLDYYLRVGTDKNGKALDEDSMKAIRAYIKTLQQKVKAQGLWGFHLGAEEKVPGAAAGRRQALGIFHDRTSCR